MLQKLKGSFKRTYFLPILLILTACNDSNDDQSITQPDNSKKPLIRCAP